MIEIDEKKVIKRAAKGDAGAFEQLVLTYQTPIYNLCLRMIGNPEDAADLTQEAFIKAWKNLGGFQFESAFSTWLYRLASNTCLDHLRSVKRRPQVSLTAEDSDGETQTMDFPDPAPSPEAAVIVKEEQELLARAMDALDEQQRQILTLRAVNELSYAEIAELLGIKEGTVKSRLARTRDALRKILLESGNKDAVFASKTQKGGCGIEL